MKDFRKQKKELLRDDNKKCFLHYGATQQKAEKGKRGQRKSVKGRNGRSSHKLSGS